MKTSTPTDPTDEPSLDRIVRCPTCGGDSIYARSNGARPFCSERCKNMDFGAWASENFRMPTTPDSAEQALDDSDIQ